MNNRSFFRDVADAYSLPFRKQGIKAFLFSFLFTLIPVTSFIGEGAAYSAAAGRRGGIGEWTKLGLKIIVIRILYAAPAVAVYGLYTLLATYLFLGFGFQFILLFLLILFATRALVLIPVASCALAMGAPLKIAVNGKEMNSIITGSMGRYILTGIMCLLMLFVFDLPMQSEWQLFIQYVLAALFVVLYRFFKAGLFMGVMRHSLGIDPPAEYRKSNGDGIAKAVVAVGLSLVLICNSSLSILASGMDNADGYIRYDRWDEEPQPVPEPECNPIYRKEEIFRYYNGARIPFGDTGSPSIQTIRSVLGDICNVTPGVSEIKNGFQAVGYYVLGATTDDEEQRLYYHANALYKTIAVFTGCMTSWGAKALQLYDKTMSWLGFSDDVLGTKTDEFMGPATIIVAGNKLVREALNKAGDAFNRADVALGDLIDFTTKETKIFVSESVETLKQYAVEQYDKASEVYYDGVDLATDEIDWWLTVPQPMPGQNNVFIEDPFNPLNTDIRTYGFTNSEETIDIGFPDIDDNEFEGFKDYEDDEADSYDDDDSVTTVPDDSSTNETTETQEDNSDNAIETSAEDDSTSGDDYQSDDEATTDNEYEGHAEGWYDGDDNGSGSSYTPDSFPFPIDTGDSNNTNESNDIDFADIWAI